MTPLEIYIRLKASRFGWLFDRPVPSGAIFGEVERTVWMYWADGLSAAPDLVKLCVRSWQVTNPGWRVVVLTDETVGEVVDLSDVEGIGLPVQKRANVLRTRLMARHGGVWCDGTLLCAIPLDHWLPVAMQSDAFMFARPGPDRIVGNWFMAARKGSVLFTELDRAYTRYLTAPPPYLDERRRKPPFYNHHYTVEYLALANPRFRRAFRAMPKVSARPPQLLQEWRVAGAAGPRPDLTGIPVHKLNWKQPVDHDILLRVACETNPALGRNGADPAAARA